MQMNTCAIIVSYNRKNSLLKCIRAVLRQSFRVKCIYIIDNASTDGTFEFLVSKGILYNKSICENSVMWSEYQNVTLGYFRMSFNTGGAGGFAKGLELAHSTGLYDIFWMMDDDGYPSKECLERQVAYIQKYDYVMPVSINIDNHIEMSWPTVMRNGHKTLSYKVIQDSWGVVMNYVYPFNGSLLSKRIVDEVGYINKNFFIWGDEYEHYWRCKRKGFSPVTVTDAIFYHPANKMSFIPIMGGLINVPYSDSKLRMVCLARNYTYIYWNYGFKYKIILKFFLYTWLFIFTRNFDIAGYKLYLLSVLDGIKGNFKRHLKYLN